MAGPTNSVSCTLENYLDEVRLDEALGWIQEAGVRQQILQEAMELVRVVMNFLFLSNRSSPLTPLQHQRCGQILDFLCGLSTSKEVIMALIEYPVSVDTCIRHVLPAVGVALKSLDLGSTASPRIYLWVLCWITARFRHDDQSANPEYDEEEEDGQQQSAEIFAAFCQDLVTFLRAHRSEEESQWKACQCYLVVYIVRTLAKPLSCSDLSDGSPGLGVAADLVSILAACVPNPMALVCLISYCKQYLDNLPDEVLEIPSGEWQCGIMTLFYMVLMKPTPTFNRSWIPSCYAPSYLWGTIVLPCLSAMTQARPYKGQISLKAVDLVHHLLVHEAVGQFHQDQLEPEFLSAHYVVIVSHCVQAVRKMAFLNLQKYVGLCTDQAKFSIINYILSKSHHSGLIGYAIQVLKETVVSGLKIGEVSPLFRDQSLIRLVRTICQLKDHELTNILTVSDEVLSCLNFLTVIISMDASTNTTGILKIIPELQTEYLEQLKRGLEMSRIHHKLMLEDNLHDRLPTDFTLTVGGFTLSALNKPQRQEVIQSALSTLDLIDCGLALLSEHLARCTQSDRDT